MHEAGTLEAEVQPTAAAEQGEGSETVPRQLGHERVGTKAGGVDLVHRVAPPPFHCG